jgi:hypothetical protein
MIEIVENFLNPKYVDYLEDLIVSSKLPLYYNKKTVDVDYSPSESFVVLENAKDSSQFTHHFIRDKEIVSDFWQWVAPINIFLMAKCGVNADMDLDRVKLNIKCQDSSCNKNEHSIPHLDVIDKKGITGIYYVNDSDGDTLFFDKDMNIFQRNSPKKGSLIYFDNTIFHAGQSPITNDYRSVINFNWVEK